MDANTISAVAAVLHESQPAIKQAVTFIESLLGDVFKVAGAMLGDHLYAFRVRRLVSLAEKTKKILDEAGIEPKQLPPGVLISLLESASVADSEEIHDIFAKLLAASVSEDIYQHPAFRYAVSQLNPDEARILAYLGSGGELQIYSSWEAPQTSYPPRTAIGGGGCVGAAAGGLVEEVECWGCEGQVVFRCGGQAWLSRVV